MINSIMNKESILNTIGNMDVFKKEKDLKARCIHGINRCKLMDTYSDSMEKLIKLLSDDIYSDIVELVTKKGDEVINELFIVQICGDTSQIGQKRLSASQFNGRFNYYIRSVIEFVNHIEIYGIEKTRLYGMLVTELTPFQFLRSLALCLKMKPLLDNGFDVFGTTISEISTKSGTIFSADNSIHIFSVILPDSSKYDVYIKELITKTKAHMSLIITDGRCKYLSLVSINPNKIATEVPYIDKYRVLEYILSTDKRLCRFPIYFDN